MGYRFEFDLYKRHFRQPLKTRYGSWEIREGIIIRLIDETGKIGWGEIAPLPWFGSETLAQAVDFCQQLPRQITVADIFSIPAQFPACQFGFESACWADKKMGGWGEFCQDQMPNFNSKITFSYLLPTGVGALESCQMAWQQGYRTFKWKIGVSAFEEELGVFEQLIQALPGSVKIRLDGNGGLSEREAQLWLQVCDQMGIVEFLEQPLPPDKFEQMLDMSKEYATPIGLDESVAKLDQLVECYEKGWREIFVIKAAIAGSPKRLRQFCKVHDIDAVFSSVFETAIGRQAALILAAELSGCDRAVGFGINHWFREDK